MDMSNPVGRPPKFESPEKLQQLIDLYFETNEGVNTPTVTGLALHLDTTRETLNDYEKNGEYSDTVKKGKARVARFIEQRLYGNNVTGLIFNLKNNFGWVDKTEQDITSKGEQISIGPDSVAAANYAAFLRGQKQ